MGQNATETFLPYRWWRKQVQFPKRCVQKISRQCAVSKIIVIVKVISYWLGNVQLFREDSVACRQVFAHSLMLLLLPLLRLQIVAVIAVLPLDLEPRLCWRTEACHVFFTSDVELEYTPIIMEIKYRFLGMSSVRSVNVYSYGYCYTFPS
jgi:hypothetical protein